MKTSNRAVATVLSAPLILLISLNGTAARADTPAPAKAVPGAMPNDKTMTCEMIAAERTVIGEAVAAKALQKEKSAKLKKGLFGFAKNMATAMVPGAALLGGNSTLGSLAAQGATQSAAQIMGSAGGAGPAPAATAQPTADQAARLTRLDAIAAYRQCAA